MPDNKGHDSKGKGKDGKGKKDKGERKEENFALSYGWALSFLKEFPELYDIFQDAVKHTWSASRFRAEVMESKWYTHHADTARKWLYLQQTDPATAEQRMNQERRTIADLAGSLGLEANGKQLDAWAQKSLLLGWDESKLRNVLARTVNIMGKHSVGGELAASMEQLNQKAYLNGVNINKKTMQVWLREITRGNSTVEEYNEYIKKMAAKRYPNLRQEINAGLNVMDIADPYRQTMAELLEVNPNQIDLNSKLMKRAISQRVGEGKDAHHEMMDLTDFEDAVRKDPRWMRTDNAKETMMDMGTSLLDLFGFTSSS